jgi:predicted nucleic acid-binding protein
MPFVLDSSVVLAWLLPDESNEAADRLADRLEQEVAVVPAIWALEIVNALLMAQRRGRIKDEELDRFLTAVLTLPIEVDRESVGPGMSAILALARKLGLTAYDSAYLELAGSLQASQGFRLTLVEKPSRSRVILHERSCSDDAACSEP